MGLGADGIIHGLLAAVSDNRAVNSCRYRPFYGKISPYRRKSFMKLFISSDIEGTAGIVNWKETKPGDQYGYFAGQMTKEVAAACEG